MRGSNDMYEGPEGGVCVCVTVCVCVYVCVGDKNMSAMIWSISSNLRVLLCVCELSLFLKLS